jgi:glycosyltransferase involved in cell wall biosynthesis
VPSVQDESFGNAAVEGVLAARPTVVSDLAGLREAVEGYDSALVVPPGAPDGWAEAVQRIVAAWPWFRAVAAQDAARARNRHAPDRYRDRLSDVVLGACALPAGGRRARPAAASVQRGTTR